MGVLLINQGTQSAINFDLSGTVNTQVIGIGYGTLNTLGTLPNLPGGTLNNLASGTINSATVVLNNGTLNVGTFTANGGTIQAATISQLPNLPGGTLNNLASGTINASTAILNNGTINLATVQMTSGTLNNLASGTINAATAILNSGTINVGTFVNNGGTVAVIQNAGTLQGGTINTGTFRPDARTTQNMIGYGTNIANSGAAAATIVGSTSVGAGTSLWMNNISIVNPNGTVLCVLGFGTAQQGTNVFWRGVLGSQTSPGVVIPYPRASNRGMTNQDLVFSTGAAGTVDLSIDYFISA